MAWALWFGVVAAPWTIACNPKSAVVCDKLEGCGVLSGSADECVETIRRGFADDGVDGKKLTKCIDCVSVKFCNELKAGACEEDCAPVLKELRLRGILPREDAGTGGEGPG
jgi:hypothetical protein